MGQDLNSGLWFQTLLHYSKLPNICHVYGDSVISNVFCHHDVIEHSLVRNWDSWPNPSSACNYLYDLKETEILDNLFSHL